MKLGISMPSSSLAIITVIIMFKQYKLNKQNIRYQLFSHRHSIYVSTMSFLAKIIKDDNVSNRTIQIFLNQTRDSDIFFDDEIIDYLSILYKKAKILNHHNKFIESSKTSQDKRKKYLDECFEITTWFGDQFKVCNDKFKKYNDFSSLT